MFALIANFASMAANAKWFGIAIFAKRAALSTAFAPGTIPISKSVTSTKSIFVAAQIAVMVTHELRYLRNRPGLQGLQAMPILLHLQRPKG